MPYGPSEDDDFFSDDILSFDELSPEMELDFNREAVRDWLLEEDDDFGELDE